MKKLIVILVSIYSVFTTNLMAQVPNYVPTNGLVGWWPFNGNANDQSGNGNNGTVNGATLSTDRSGNVNSAYYFGGNGKYIDLGSAGLTSNPDTCSFSVWTLLDSLYVGLFGQTSVIMTKRHLDAGPSWTTIQVNSGSFVNVCIDRPSTIDNLPYNKKTVRGQWVNIIVLKERNRYSLYVNGLFYKDTLISYNHVGSSSNMYVGHSGAWNTFYYGKIDDIGIWNRALTQQEITNLYNSCGKNLAISPTNNSKMIGTNATFTATVSDTNPSYIWQSNFGQGYVTLNNFGNYSGTSTNTMSVSNVQLSNHMEPIRAISTSGNCKDTSNIAYIKITDTCITKITKYDTIKVMDTLVINANLSGISAPNNTNRIIVYPNPAKDHITIDYGVFSRMSGYTVKITNTLGQTVFISLINQQSSFINLSTWTGKGLYYLQIIDPNSNMIENRKIVLQ
jgi:hypothetical protein